jgi:hypothetical protein
VLEDTALAFLQKLDAQDYAGAWEALHPEYRKLGSFEIWKTNINRGRSQLGALKSRGPAASIRDFTTTMPKLPPGRYLLLRFPSRYEKREPVVEIVALSADAEGGWRVAGYSLN